MTKHFIVTLIATLGLMPSLVYAATDIEGIIRTVQDIIALLLPLFIGLALLYFVWGLAEFIRNSGDVKANEDGKNKMIWGTIALFVIISIWGIVAFIGSTFDIDQGGRIEAPQFRIR